MIGRKPDIEKIEDFRDALRKAAHTPRKAAPINEQMPCDSRVRSAKAPEGIPMLQNNSALKNWCYTIILFLLALTGSFLCMKLNVHEHISTVFIFAVFLISLLTDGYFYGVASAIAGTLAINYAFTYPFFALNFIIPANLISAIIMIIIAILTSTLTTKIKEQEMMKAESERERMRANLLRAVSHDLRTPLTTIYGASTTLLENGENFSPEQQRVLLQGIQEDSEWLTRMVENLLSITRIDSGKIKIIKTHTVLDELIDSVMLKFRKRYPGQEVSLELPEEIVVIPMDATLIEQVLINLLENAVLHAQGMTELSLQVFTLGNQAIFEIRDNGCGIDEARLKHIFSGYMEATDNTSDSQKRNSGIGLSVCATIIRAHGGDISAVNQKSGGSCFRFTLSIEEGTEHDKQ